MNRLLSSLYPFIAWLMVSDCGGDGGAAIVKGIVMAGGEAASGRTDSEGKFQLLSRKPNDGAVPGDYVFTVAKSDGGSEGIA